HTRFSRDWSSDVCSSDLGPRTDRAALAIDAEGSGQRRGLGRGRPGYGGTFRPRDGVRLGVLPSASTWACRGAEGGSDVDAGTLEIGRAACRGRGEGAVVA